MRTHSGRDRRRRRQEFGKELKKHTTLLAALAITGALAAQGVGIAVDAAVTRRAACTSDELPEVLHMTDKEVQNAENAWLGYSYYSDKEEAQREYLALAPLMQLDPKSCSRLTLEYTIETDQKDVIASFDSQALGTKEYQKIADIIAGSVEGPKEEHREDKRSGDERDDGEGRSDEDGYGDSYGDEGSYSDGETGGEGDGDGGSGAEGSGDEEDTFPEDDGFYDEYKDDYGYSIREKYWYGFYPYGSWYEDEDGSINLGVIPLDEAAGEESKETKSTAEGDTGSTGETGKAENDKEKSTAAGDEPARKARNTQGIKTTAASGTVSAAALQKIKAAAAEPYVYELITITGQDSHGSYDYIDSDAYETDAWNRDGWSTDEWETEDGTKESKDASESVPGGYDPYVYEGIPDDMACIKREAERSAEIPGTAAGKTSGIAAGVTAVMTAGKASGMAEEVTAKEGAEESMSLIPEGTAGIRDTYRARMYVQIRAFSIYQCREIADVVREAINREALSLSLTGEDVEIIEVGVKTTKSADPLLQERQQKKMDAFESAVKAKRSYVSHEVETLSRKERKLFDKKLEEKKEETQKTQSKKTGREEASKRGEAGSEGGTGSGDRTGRNGEADGTKEGKESEADDGDENAGYGFWEDIGSEDSDSAEGSDGTKTEGDDDIPGFLKHGTPTYAQGSESSLESTERTESVEKRTESIERPNDLPSSIFPKEKAVTSAGLAVTPSALIAVAGGIGEGGREDAGGGAAGEDAASASTGSTVRALLAWYGIFFLWAVAGAVLFAGTGVLVLGIRFVSYPRIWSLEDLGEVLDEIGDEALEGIDEKETSDEEASPEGAYQERTFPEGTSDGTSEGTSFEETFGEGKDEMESTTTAGFTRAADISAEGTFTPPVIGRISSEGPAGLLREELERISLRITRMALKEDRQRLFLMTGKDDVPRKNAAWKEQDGNASGRAWRRTKSTLSNAGNIGEKEKAGEPGKVVRKKRSAWRRENAGKDPEDAIKAWGTGTFLWFAGFLGRRLERYGLSLTGGDPSGSSKAYKAFVSADAVILVFTEGRSEKEDVLSKIRSCEEEEKVILGCLLIQDPGDPVSDDIKELMDSDEDEEAGEDEKRRDEKAGREEKEGREGKEEGGKRRSLENPDGRSDSSESDGVPDGGTENSNRRTIKEAEGQDCDIAPGITIGTIEDNVFDNTAAMWDAGDAEDIGI